MNKYRDFDNYFKEYPDENGNPETIYSNASGLDYPAVGPEHANLHDMGRVNYVTVGDEEAMEVLWLWRKIFEIKNGRKKIL